MSAPGDRLVQYSFGVLRAVPHPYTGEGVGVVVHSRPADYLEVRVVSAPERFHWLTSPRSDVLQCSEVHAGMSADPAPELERSSGRTSIRPGPPAAPDPPEARHVIPRVAPRLQPSGGG